QRSGRSSSAAKKAEADFRMALARRSSFEGKAGGRPSAWEAKGISGLFWPDLRWSGVGAQWTVGWFPGVPRGSPQDLARVWHDLFVPNH
ncbi:hypothetical protein, partial [Streptomyces sp. M2CJ-2]|uniref:hypothetical protein n=1 Tax=Streptomyces sp. M2CJ-2 TaxID=2803948 RepID=UPI001F36D99E